jgi:RsiW-degrading membrane proteinase PrsW (M82 family)
MFNVTNSSAMFGCQLSSVQSTSILNHLSDFFLVLIAFLFVWFILTTIIALVFVNKGRKKGQVMWVFIVSLIILLVVLFISSMYLDKLLLWIGGI